eukprot:NODE_327_length_989_cov_489.568085_g283_i0.p1 GENE.NODE_327_length_989_cov_489.568085_g283_i0~~NODE_327_length_989_cov_489.568085_g283_i0.p1  ORF type:complete len:223 (-),score=76.81 NODE_327_length_989_cov_489.568085_g283_i0:235-903(-)
MPRADLIEQAKKADQDQDFDKMVDCMKQVVRADPRLNTEERNMLHIAYKTATGKRRDELRKNPTDRRAPDEIAALCTELLDMLDHDLLPNAAHGESKLFWMKMKADYHRYNNEVRPSPAQKKAAEDTYSQAFAQAKRDLPTTNPLRLMIALNAGVFYYEAVGDRKYGYDLTRDAFETAMRDMERLDEEQKKESGFVLGLLRDNVLIWSDEMGIPRPEAPPQQ